MYSAKKDRAVHTDLFDREHIIGLKSFFSKKKKNLIQFEVSTVAYQIISVF